MRLKLYRGLAAREFEFLRPTEIQAMQALQRQLLSMRSRRDFRYPKDLDRAIREFQEQVRLKYQYFSDSKAIATAYAKKINGLLVEIEVDLEDSLKHFDIEFQNFSKRKSRFEIVYRVPSSILKKNQKRWKMRVRRVA